jgi:hypothetical protein
MSLDVQDSVAAEVAARFPADPREAKIVDRRAATSHGYRAVHVVVSLDGVSIEVQVRTLLQHMWADLMERLADRLGRQIRYGGAPVPPAGVSQAQADGVVTMMMSASNGWAQDEIAADHLTLPDGMLPVDRITDEVWNRISALLRQSGIDL